MKKGIQQVLITEQNLKFAISVQNAIFPHYSAQTNYEESIAGITNNEYWLLYLGDECIGISGLYFYDIDCSSAWLGWFGILPKFRHMGYGSESIDIFMEEARKRNFDFMRLYTDEIDNADAVQFYLKKGFVSEPYLNPNDINRFTGQILIFSKSLSTKALVPWENKNIGFAQQLVKQKI